MPPSAELFITTLVPAPACRLVSARASRCRRSLRPRRRIALVMVRSVRAVDNDEAPHHHARSDSAALSLHKLLRLSLLGIARPRPPISYLPVCVAYENVTGYSCRVFLGYSWPAPLVTLWFSMSFRTASASRADGGPKPPPPAVSRTSRSPLFRVVIIFERTCSTTPSER